MNVYKPLIGFNLLQSIRMLKDAMTSFRQNLVEGLEPDREQIQRFVDRSLMLITALTPSIGYEKASAIAQHAHHQGLTLKQAALELGHIITAIHHWHMSGPTPLPTLQRLISCTTPNYYSKKYEI